MWFWFFEYIELPGVLEVVRRIEEAGGRAEWVTEAVDKSEGHVCFDNGKKFKCYKSDCPHYVGYWFSGGSAGVECRCCYKLIPGIQHDLFCSREYKKCVFYREVENERNSMQRKK